MAFELREGGPLVNARDKQAKTRAAQSPRSRFRPEDTNRGREKRLDEELERMALPESHRSLLSVATGASLGARNAPSLVSSRVLHPQREECAR